MIGVLEEMRSKSSMSSSTPASRATASRCRTPLVEPPLVATAAIAFSSDSRVMMSLGRWPRREHVHHELAGAVGDLLLALVLGRDAGVAHRRDAEHLERHRHRVGGELAAAGAEAGRRRPPRARVELLVGDLARGVRADRLEDLQDRDVAGRRSGRARSSRRRASRSAGPGARAPSRCRGSSCRSPTARRPRRTCGRGRRARSSRRSPRG